MAYYVLVCIATALIAVVHYYFKYTYSYWQKRGVPFIRPRMPLGNIQGMSKRLHSSQLMQRFYKELKGQNPFGGLYFFNQPAVLLTDLDLVKNVLIKDFNSFHDRNTYYNEKDDPLSAHLFSLDGQKWKTLRHKLTPTFTSGKMKFMFSSVVEVGQKFQQTIKDISSTQIEVEMKQFLARFTTDVIGTCAFGIECNSLKDPNAQFFIMGRKVFETPRNVALKQFFAMTFRNFARLLHLKLIREEVSEFFMKIVRETVEYREKNHVQRNDFMDILMQIKKDDINGEGKSEESSLTLEEIAAQVFVFFLAGFETSSTTMSYCLYELALNPALQDRLRQSIQDVLQKHDGQFTYEAMMEMHYLDQVINETLRKYPPGANLIRLATNDYAVPDTNHVIEKGLMVWIPVYAIHHDPEIYSDPEVFDPERFAPDNMRTRHPQAFIPFGDGPRNCIGLRFGMMETRVGLVTLLTNFRFKRCSKTVVPLTFSTRNIVLSPEGGLWLNVEQL